jgi:hypothetical protein
MASNGIACISNFIKINVIDSNAEKEVSQTAMVTSQTTFRVTTMYAKHRNFFNITQG